MQRRFAVLLAVLLLLLGPVVTARTAAAAGPRALGGDATAPATPGELRLTQELALTPDRPGELDVTLRYAVPSNVVDLDATLPERATVEATTGFDQTDGRTWTWDGQTRTPTLRLRYDANETGRVLGPEGDSGSFLLTDAGSWAIAKRIPVNLRYRYRGEVRVTEHLTVAGEGVAGDSMAYLGPHRTTTREAHGQTFRLVQPRAASLAPDPGAVFDSITAAADTLRVGDRDGRVTMIAAPRSVPWAVRGLQLGDSDFYVVADEGVDGPGNTWLHEYVHTRQNLSLGDDTRWFVEGSATYYAALLTLEQERIDFARFRSFLDRGSDARYRDVVLADRAAWHDGAQYWKGALVAGTLDRRIRAATDRTATLQGIWRRLNGRAGPVHQSTFLDLVQGAGGAAVTDAATQYTEQASPPSVWSRSVHEATFGVLPARVTVGLPDTTNASAWRVAGPFRNRSLAPASGRSLVTGESLTVDVPVRNAGGTTGPYDLVVTLDGAVVAQRSGEVAPDATVWEPVTVAPDAPGNYTLEVAGDRLPLSVSRPADLMVGPLRANRTAVPTGGTLRVAATVGNRADRPGEAVLPVRVDGEVRETRTVRIRAGVTTEVAATVSVADGGAHTVSIGNRSLRIAVTTPTPATVEPTGGSQGSATPVATTGGTGPGFGPLVGVLGVLVLALAARWRAG